MSVPGLKKLTIEHLRGSVVPFVLPFERNKKLTIVYGENGTGKSTICDAFEFVGKGRVGSLENRGLGKTNRYWHSVGKKPADVSVTLETMDNAICRASIVKSDVVANPPDGRPRVEILRRSQILRLVEAQPGDRYAEVSRFIDVSGVEASEATLRELIKQLNSRRGEAIAVVQANEESLQQFWESAGKPGTDPLAWANVEAKRDPGAADADVIALTALQSAYSRLVDYPSCLKSANDGVQSAKDALAVAQQKAQESVQTIASDAGELVSVLKAARTYLHKHPSPTACPLCESDDKVQGLSDRITQRLASFSGVQDVQAQVKMAESALLRANQQVEMLYENAKKHLREFETVLTGFAWPADITIPAFPQDSGILDAWLSETAHLPTEWKKAETIRQDKKQFLTTLNRALTTYAENVLAQKELDAQLPKLKRVLEIVEEERRNFSGAILAKIAGEVGRIYELVHPGEGLNKISLELDPAKRASLQIGADFCGEAGAPPQAYFSESHLDTLGLCVFLALASLDGPENTILVLDDVLASVDEPHVDRLIEMLYAEALKFRHCVITTHYGPWKHKLRWGWLKNGQCQFVELARWTNQSGLTLIRTLPDVERLKLLLVEQPPDPQTVCSKAGFILEAALNFLTLLYECAVPRKPEDRYTIGDLLPAVKGKLRQSMRVEILTGTDADGAPTYKCESLTPIFDELTRIAEARNVFGCHFKAISFELLDADALRFGQQVHVLMELLTDQEAGWPKNSNSGEYWANSNETRRLYPLRKPS